MPKNCDNCKYDLFRLCGEEDKTPCDDCYSGNPPTKWEPGENYEPKTNADRIIEELAETLSGMCKIAEQCDFCPLEGNCPGGSYNLSVWSKWLHQPAEGE